MQDDKPYGVLTDVQWAWLALLIEAVRLHGKALPRELRRTLEAIIWRHGNGAKRRAVPAELGPCWMAVQCWNHWFHLGVWERLLAVAQERGGRSLAWQARTDASRLAWTAAPSAPTGVRRVRPKGAPAPSGTRARRLGARGAATAPRP